MRARFCLVTGAVPSLWEEVNTQVVIWEEKNLVLPNDLALIPGVVNQCLLNIAHREWDFDLLKIGLQEVLVNAVEHGNLGITPEEKKEVEEQGDYYQYTLQKGRCQEYRDRVVRVRVVVDGKRILIQVADMGEGFAWQDQQNVGLDHSQAGGMGLYIARQVFDEVGYNDRGNEVSLVKYF